MKKINLFNAHGADLVCAPHMNVVADTQEVTPALRHIKPYTPSKLGELHIEILHDKLMNDTQVVLEKYKKPKLEIIEVTDHGDGSISVKIDAVIKHNNALNENVFLNIIRALNQTLAEKEEEILNGE